MKVFEMAQFPYKVGDKIKNPKTGLDVIEIKAVIQGTTADTYDGHIISEFIINRKGEKVPVGEPFIRYHYDRQNAKLEEGEMILGIRPNPAAQCVHYQIIETGRVFNVKPDVFMGILEEGYGIKHPPLKFTETTAQSGEQATGDQTYAEWGFTVEDAEFIEENYRTMTDAELAAALSTETHAVLASRVKTFRITGLGLNKNAARDKRGNAEDEGD